MISYPEASVASKCRDSGFDGVQGLLGRHLCSTSGLLVRLPPPYASTPPPANHVRFRCYASDTAWRYGGGGSPGLAGSEALLFIDFARGRVS